jgi:putative flippase GtrA
MMIYSYLKRFIGFVGVGVINTLATYFLYLIISQFISYQIAYAIVFFLGIGLSFWLNAHYVFNSDKTILRYILFALIYLFQYILAQYLLRVLVERFAVPYTLAPILLTLGFLPLTYWFTKKILKKT